jgi:formylglycine-generating enzyme required for sulfatase activity
VKAKREINVFIASPGDVQEERAIVREVCASLNRRPTIGDNFGILFRPVGGENAFPSAGRPQEIINRLVEECDVFVCILHKRFGTPSGKEVSGTLEEFLLAYEKWKSLKKPHIMLYFKEMKIRSKRDLDEQYHKVLDLKEKIEMDRTLMFCHFSDPEDFRNLVARHLEQWVFDTFKPIEPPEPKPTVSLQVFGEYLKSAFHEHRHMPTQGFETTLRILIDLERVFIKMHGIIHGWDFEYTLKGMERMKQRLAEEKLQSIDIKGAISVAKRHNIKNIVVLGTPGSGKTTLLKYILLTIIGGKSGDRLGIQGNLIPFFAPLRELKDPDAEGLLEFIARICCLRDFNISADGVSKALAAGKAVALLDGLDEVANEERRIKICKWIDRARRRYPDAWFIISSRFAGYTGRSRLEGSALELAIQDLTIAEAGEFLSRWFEAVETALHPGDEEQWGRKGREEAGRLLERIMNSAHLSKLAVTPLLLQIIAFVHRDRGRLPERRVELYEECTNVLLEKWDMAKGLDVLLSAREARQILQPLALWLHEVDERRSAPLGEITSVIRAPLDGIGKSSVDPEKLLLNIRDRSGIFMGYSESEYGFTHLSFQEYLTAEQVRNKRKLETLIDNYGKKWWREVIRLCLALDNPSVIEEFMERIIREELFKEDIGLVQDAVSDSIVKPSTPFIHALGNADLPYEARINAVRILRLMPNEKVITALRGVAAGEDKGLAVTAYETLETLGKAAGIAKPAAEELPGVFINPKDGSEMVLVPAGSFLYGSKEDDPFARSDEKPQRLIELPSFYIDRYPVTNEKYCRFLNDEKPDDGRLARWIILKMRFERERCRITKEGAKFGIEKGYDRHPVIYVSWYGADAYAKWADKKLPSEEEWEKAARGTDGREYPWGVGFDKDKCNTNESGIGATSRVTRYPNGVSPYGCYDMAGNVWEWTDSSYEEKKENKVLRGGSWLINRGYARCANRVWNVPVYMVNTLGFRCVRNV